MRQACVWAASQAKLGKREHTSDPGAEEGPNLKGSGNDPNDPLNDAAFQPFSASPTDSEGAGRVLCRVILINESAFPKKQH